MRSPTVTVMFGASQLRYRLQRSDRKKTVSIAVDPHEGVLVTAPQDIDTERVHQIVIRKAGWIADKLRRLRDIHGDDHPREFVSGESFSYLGRHYRLKVMPCPGASASLRLSRGRFEVTIASGQSLTKQSATIRTELCRWYRDHAAQRVPERVALLAPRLGMIPPSILIRDQQRRWASCDRKGRVRVNWRIVMAPMSLVDYVVAHELCHLIHPDHSARFWKLLRTVLPDYEERRERLRREGPRFCF